MENENKDFAHTLFLCLLLHIHTIFFIEYSTYFSTPTDISVGVNYDYIQMVSFKNCP